MTSKLTIEFMQNIISGHGFGVAPSAVKAMAEYIVAAMDSEPVAWMHSNNDIGIPAITVSQKIGHYWMAEFENVQPLYRHAQPAPETEREPIAWLNDAYLARGVVDGEAGSEDAGPGYIPVYREPATQPAPVVPGDVLDALQKVARIRLDLNDFDGDRRGIADCLCDAEEALIEVVNRRAAMLAAAQHDTPALNSLQSVVTVPGKWIPVSERMPEKSGTYQVWNGEHVGAVPFLFGSFQCLNPEQVTHWMPTAKPPREVK